MKKKTKKMVVILLIILFVIVVAGISAYFLTKPKLEFINKEFKVEYGEKINIKTKDILKSSNNKVMDSVKINFSSIKNEEDKDYPKIGKYNIKVIYKIRNKTKEENISVVVEDTIAPEFTKSKDSFELEQGLKKYDYLKYFETADLSEVEINIDDSAVDYSKPGEYKINIKATDSSGNENVIQANVVIKEKKVVSSSTGSTSSSSGTNTNGCSATNTEPYYYGGILVVNKKHPLPCGYAPGENSEAGQKIRTLIADMKSLGYNISDSYSGYRSYATQSSLYQRYVNANGQAKADTFSARPGYSEHQTGLAFDLKHTSEALVASGTKEAIWIAENAYKYGFILRYLSGKENVTGYVYEPWHLRYIGSQAEAISKSGKTLEEYLGFAGGSYN